MTEFNLHDDDENDAGEEEEEDDDDAAAGRHGDSHLKWLALSDGRG